MLIENKGIRTETFYIPPFNLKEGELIVLFLYGGQHFHDTEMLLKDIFSGKTKNENVIVHKELTFVEHIIEPGFRGLFRPLTVGEYLKKNADLNSPFATKIYETKWINPKTKINTLARNPKRLLSLYATLSKTKSIIFDLVGQDPKGAEDTCKVVKEVAKSGGSAILLDWSNDLKNDCTEYIELEWIK